MKKLFPLFALFILACSNNNSEQIVNMYSQRHYDVDQLQYDNFEKITGIKVNVIKANADELIQRMKNEGENSPADLFITVDVGKLWQASDMDLLQKYNDESLTDGITESLKDPNGFWVPVTYRSRILVYSNERVQESDLSTYEDLANEKWKGRICIRSSSNIYNQSLLASMIAHNGENEAESWAKKVVNNFSRKPKGNDRSQMTAVVLNECDITLANTYYLGKWITSDKNTEREYSDKIAVFFPNQKGRGAHVNISGAAVIKTSKNTSSAIKFIEFLASNKAQKLYSQTNHEYPIRDNIQVSKIVESWGYPFKKDKLSLNKLGMFNKKAVVIFDKVGWK